MWKLAIAFVVSLHGHSRDVTTVMDYPTRFTCERALEMLELDPQRALRYQNLRLRHARHRGVARSFYATCEPQTGLEGFPYSDRGAAA